MARDIKVYETPSDFMAMYPDIKGIKISTPSGSHKKFRIQGQVNGKYVSIHVIPIQIANQHYLDKISDYTHTYEKLKSIVNQLNACRPKAVFNSENLRIAEEYWKKEYPPSRLTKMEAPLDARYKIFQAIEAIGNLPIATAHLQDLQGSIDTLPPNTQRRIVSRLNSILTFIGRTERLTRVRKPSKRVHHISLSDLRLVLNKLPEPFKTLCAVAFYTGMRCGEIFALTEDAIRTDDVLWVDKQIRRNKKEGKTKNNKDRKVIIIPDGMGYVRAWIDLNKEDKERLRSEKHAEMLKGVCKELWPTNTIKHCKFHDLRHSYAIHLAGKGISLDDIARSLGNSSEVCEEYYIGYVISDAGIARVLQQLRADT